MYMIPPECVPLWTEFSGRSVPSSVDSLCPRCGRQVNFTLRDFAIDEQRRTVSASASCPACHQEAYFWIVGAQPADSANAREPDAVCIYPPPKVHRKPISGIEAMPEGLARAYLSALNVYNAREWNATAVCCRRVLEGVVKNLLPKQTKAASFAQSLELLPQYVDLTRPVKTLSHSVRHGGNLGAQFELDREADQETATAMLDLLEYFLDYLYALPRKVENLDARIRRGPEENRNRDKDKFHDHDRDRDRDREKDRDPDKPKD